MTSISVMVRPDGLVVLTRGFLRCVLNADRTYREGSYRLFSDWYYTRRA